MQQQQQQTPTPQQPLLQSPAFGGPPASPAPGAEEPPLNLTKTPRDNAALLEVLETLTKGDPSTELPLGLLNTVTRHVSVLSKRAAPKLLMQKRQFVRGWHIDERTRRGLAVDPATGALAARAPKTADQLFAEVDARIEQTKRSITQADISDAIVDQLAEQICAMHGVSKPNNQRERRDLITRWHAQQTKLRSGSLVPRNR